ncbi:MAG: D-beta-hydroxybutyrate dehydrogenase, partial [Microgenomates group bacterium GW2011_GWC1_49_7]
PPDWGIYVSSKFAARGFTQSLRLELAKTNIKVMALYPGGMNTDLFIKAGNQNKNEPWMMDKEDVVEIILFMLTRPKDMVIHELVVRKFFGK